MLYYFSRIPAAAIFPMFDGNQYAHIPHTADGDKVCEDFKNPRMVRYVEIRIVLQKRRGLHSVCEARGCNSDKRGFTLRRHRHSR